MSEKYSVQFVPVTVPLSYDNWLLLSNKKQLFELKPLLTPAAYVELCSKFKQLYSTLDDSIKKLDSEQTEYESKMRCCFVGIVVPYRIWARMQITDMESILKLALDMQLNVILVT